jgi:hypothetical protein
MRNECNGVSREIRQCPLLPSSLKCEQTGSKNRDLSEWSEWSECSVKCGIGSRTRIRRCDKSRDFLTPCETGSELIMERTICNVSCSDNDAGGEKLGEGRGGGGVIEGKWSAWSEWSKCSSECGAGMMQRRRMCLSNVCPGLGLETKACVNNMGCKVNALVTSSTKKQNLTDDCKNGCSRSNWLVLLNPLRECFFKEISQKGLVNKKININ